LQILGLILILINVGAIAAPVTAVAVVYSSNPLEMVIPPQVEQIVNSTINTGESVQPPQYISSTFDPSTKTITASFSFTNPYNLNMKIKMVSADVKCAADDFMLGNASLVTPVQLDAGATAVINIIFTWTQEAEDYLNTMHSGETNLDVRLVNLGVDVSGITVQVPQSIDLNVPLVQ
jgi:hypothetical protein